MGPRARRRLATASGIVLVAVGAGAAVSVTHSSTHSTGKEVYGTFGAFGVSYGWTANHVRAQVGAPSRKRNACWVYDVRNATLGGTKLPAEVGEIDAVRYCFAEGVVSVIEDHWPPGSGWPHPWNVPVTFGCGGKKCVNTS